MPLLPLQEMVHAKKFPATEAGRQIPYIAEPTTDSVLAGLASVNLTTHASDTNVEKFTDIAANIQYIDGLPSVVIANALPGSDPTPPHHLCNTFLPKVLPHYVEKLSKGEDPIHVMQALLIVVNLEARELHESYAHGNGAQFNFSCALSYLHNGKIRVASIGTGSNLIAICRQIEQSGHHYISIKAAASLCPSIEVDEIIAQNKPLSEETQSLPVRGSENIEMLLSINSVGDIELKEGDQIVALNKGAFNFLPLDYERLPQGDDKTLLLRSLAQSKVSPEFLLEFNREQLQSNFQSLAKTPSSSLINDDAICAIATIPNVAQQQAIRIQALADFADCKNRIINTLLTLYPWRPSLFGHHHHDRRNAICRAIRQAEDMTTINEILDNQFSVLSSGAHVQPISHAILDPRWSGKETLQNAMSLGVGHRNVSGYFQAVTAASMELRKFYIL